MDAPTPIADTHVWYDLSAAQRGVWLDLHLQDNPSGYQLGGWARVDADIDLDIAIHAVSLVMARNDALRLRVDVHEPRQRIEPSAEAPVRISDLSNERDPHAAFGAYAARAFARGFPLGDEPLLGIDLVRAGPRCWYLLWRCHHLIGDSISVAVALRRWTEAYDALSGEGSAELSASSSFIASIAPELKYEASAAAGLDLVYWRERFARPTDPLFESIGSGADGKPVTFQIDGKSYERYRASCQRCGVTSQRGMLALIAIALARVYGRREVALGVALHRRGFATRETLGMFAGLLPVRCAIDPDGALDQNVGLIGAALDQDFRHQRVSLDVLGRALGTPSTAPTPLFQVVVSHLLEDAAPPALALGGRPVLSEMYRGPETSPLALYIAERPYAGALAVELASNPHYVDADLRGRLAVAVERALRCFIEAPKTFCDELDILDDADRACVLAGWNALSCEFPCETLPTLFARQVADGPDAFAVEDGHALTYAALDAASDALAATLQSHGVGVETVVGVALPRSLRTVISLLAILKTGGVYLPLDPAYPPERLAFMLADAGAALVITDETVAPSLPDTLPHLFPDAAMAYAQPKPVALRPDHLAYIVYTSGSTGTPKGVAVSHAAAANVAFARRHGHDPIGPGDRVLAAISVGFDVSIGQLLLPLLSGACVVIAPDLRTLSADAFWALICERRVSHVNSVPSFFDSVLEAAPPDAPLRRLMLGGEALSGALCHRLHKALPKTELVNMYGPTEACIDATAYPVPAGVGESLLPIGRPLANYRAYVLDARLRPVPPGVAGELFLGGPGLARGYVGQAGLTAWRFVADPFGAPGARLYRTGDRAAWRSDGTLSFLGRDDGQVKIRGFRVELGEIEAALRTHPAVSQAAVVAQDGARLIGYVVGPATHAALRDHLAERLPGYMVPSVFVTLDTMPLTQNGKLDRRALVERAPAEERSSNPPSSPLEAQIAAMFESLLGVTNVGAYDDFFMLGGHSLLATRLVSRIRAECGVDLPLRAVFAAPTVAALANAIDSHTGRPAEPRLIAGPRPAVLPLSFAQQRLWVLDQLGASGGAYVIAVALRLIGHLDARALDAALCGVVARHESLRTRFEIADGVAVQTVMDQVPTTLLTQDDLSAIAEDAHDLAVQDRFRAIEQEKFDLGTGHLLRASVLRLASDTHVLILAIHHIVSDGWSMGVLLGELTALYGAALNGQPDPLPPLPVQYADWTLWQRHYLTETKLSQLLDYWRGALADAPLSLDLPLDRPRPATPSYRGQSVAWHCPPALAARLQTRAHDADVTLFMLVLTAFQGLLARWTGATDLLVGTPIAQRTLEEAEPLIGFFVNTLALRADVTGRPRFAEMLARGRETVLGAFAHQDLPFEVLVQALQPERDLGRAPIVQVMFVMQNTPMPPAELPGLRMEPMAMPLSVAKFDLTLAVTPMDDGGLTGAFEYATDLFDSATIERLSSWFSRILTAVAEDPAVRIDDVEVLDAAERALILEHWNPTPTLFPSDVLPALFSAQVAYSHDNQAVVEAGTSLTYAALDAASDALAATLQSNGVGIETVVGVALPRSLQTVISLLAILKAGGVYLPLDPAYPPERLAFMLADAGAALVITDETVAPSLPDTLPHLFADAATPYAQPKPVALRPDHLAYIVYTSGSTGTPKGVAVSHAAAANVAFARRHGHDPIGPGDRVLAAISVGFDVSIGQLLLPLLSGACVVIAPDLRTLSADAFWALICERRVSHVNSVPSFFDSVLEAAPPDAPLRRLMLGGEALSGALCHRLHKALPKTELVNMYGPTEACIDATAYPVPAGVGESLLPIGRPLANYRAYVLDARLRPVPPGVAGELFLGGPGLARGYVGQAGLTAWRFVADPFGAPGARLYRTGDRAAWRSDGTLSFLGRDDGQVKIRGFRVELGEIEAALRTHPAVSQAAVVAQDGARLIGYVVGPATHAALRDHLAERLPGYMVPSVFVTLDTMPLTQNGKLDRRALVAPVSVELVADASPVDEREALLCSLFSELTGVRLVGRNDGFFNIGGDSISAIRLVSLARSRGRLAIEVSDVFAHPTPAALALVAVEATADGASDYPASGEMLPTPLQHALMLNDAPTERFHQTVALHPPAETDPARIGAALVRLVREHAALRLVRLGRSLSIIDDAPAPVLRQIVFNDAAELERPVAALSAGFDLGQGAAVSALLAVPQDSGQPGVLFLAIHHFAVDGLSWRILLDDLATLCASEDPLTAPLPPATLPIRAWTAHLHAEAQRRSAELPLWQAMLAEPLLPIPANRWAANTVGGALTLSRRLPEEMTGRLLAAPGIYRAEINDVLLAALGIALAAWRRQDGQGSPVQVVTVEGHGRETGETGLDVSRTIGWFTSAYPVRLDMSGFDLDDALAGGVTAGEAIKRVKTVLRSIPDHGLGFGLLRHLNADTAAELTLMPEPEVLFNYLGRFAHASETRADRWRPALLPYQPLDDLTRRRDPVLIEANALLDGSGALHIGWTYSPGLADGAVAALADLYLAALEAVATHCEDRPLPQPLRLIAADFPEAAAAGLDNAGLAIILSETPDLEAVVPLTPLQQGLLFETMLRPEGADPYQVQGVLRLEGAVEPDTMRAAWLSLTKRHDVLRLTIPRAAYGAGLGVLRPAEALLGWHVCDWRHLDTDAAERSLALLLAEDREAGFDLAAGPLARMILVRRSETTAWLVASNHHALLDGWSMPLLIAELLRICAAAPLPPTLPWRKFLGWLARKDREEAVGFWRQQYQGIAPDSGALALPPPVTVEAGVAETHHRVAPDVSAALEAFSRRNGLTMAAIALGAWALVLRPLRAAATDDLVLGVISGGRPATLPGSESAVGLFIQTLPLRVPMQGSAAVVDWLRQVQTSVTEQEAHGWLGLPAIRHAAGMPGDRAPFDAVFVFENYPREAASAAEMPIRLVGIDSYDSTHYPIGLAVLPGAHGLALRLTFDKARLAHADAAALAERLAALLADLAAADTQTILDSLPTMPAVERDQVLAMASGNARIWPDETLPTLFARRVADGPGAFAVEDGHALTYAALDAASDALAATLQSNGVGVETVVGVALPRSLQTVISLLAILKAGGVYLPLDPAYPPERLAFMLADAGAALVITDETVAPSLPDTLPHLFPDAATPYAQPKPVALRPDHLAYIVYTSGSTGTPKGVAVSHAAAANVAFARRHGHDPIGPGDRVLAAISVGFDVSIGQLLLPLLSGACVVIAPDLRTLSADAFWALICERRVSHVNSVPSFFDSVLEAAPPDAPLRRLMLGGEALSGALCHRLHKALPKTELVNMYGPTEACIDATAYPVPAGVGESLLPIGRPLANYRAYVLDARLRPVPPGVAGELFLGGPGLARGYVGQAGLTAWRFVADPFGAPGARLYRTGDRAAWRSDGTLSFLGRDDGQVKIRGFRVELGEIEAALRTHPAVSQAAVVAQDGARLIGYVVGPATHAALRDHLAERLPGYMVPSVFVTLDTMPLTQNGKLDRRALVAPVLAGRERIMVVPRDEIEFRLQAIWLDVLRLPEIGLQDDFFHIGGDSLLGIRLITACNAAFDATLPVSALFAHPTIETMAMALRQDATRTGGPLVTLRPGPAEIPPLVCVHPQGGTVFCYGPMIRHLPPGRKVIGVQATGLEPGSAMPDTLEEMAASYVEALRSTHAGPYALLGYSMGGSIAFEMARQLRAMGEVVTGLALLDTWRPDGAPTPQQTHAELLAMLAEDLGLPPASPPLQTNAALFAAAEAAGVLPPGFSMDQAERIIGVWANNAQLVRAYQPPAGLDVRLLQVRATEREIPLSDWSAMVIKDVTTVDLDCSHRGLVTADHAQELAAAVIQIIQTKECS